MDITNQYPWYDVVEDHYLEQGDLLKNCPVLEPIWNESVDADDKTYNLQARELRYDVLVMTQSCDLANDKVDMVLVCPCISIEVFEQQNWPDRNKKEKGKFRESIRQGQMPGYHMLAPCDIQDSQHDIQIVSFYQVFSLPKTLVSHIANRRVPRIRLLPPYREHLGQAFARFFMRVGLPIDIPRQR